MKGKIFVSMIFLMLTLSASYIIHMQVEEGYIVQKGVYETDSEPDAYREDGNLSLSLGDEYSTTFDPYMWVASDPDDMFDERGEQLYTPKVEEIIYQRPITDIYVVVPDVDPETDLKVEQDGVVLIDEPLMQPKKVRSTKNDYVPSKDGTGEFCMNDTDCPAYHNCYSGECVYIGAPCQDDGDCVDGEYCLDSMCTPYDEDPCAITIVPMTLIGLGLLNNFRKIGDLFVRRIVRSD